MANNNEITLYSKDAVGNIITQFYPRKGWENPEGVHKAPVMHLKSRGFSPVKPEVKTKPEGKLPIKNEVKNEVKHNPTTGSGSGSQSIS